MNNVIQSINITDIISNKFQPNVDEQKRIEELSELIKNFGAIDPILVRPKNGKYEIVSGIEKYRAAKLAGLNQIPAIIKEFDDEAFSKYLKIDNQQLVEHKFVQPKPVNKNNNNFAIPLEKKNTDENLLSQKWLNQDNRNNSDIVNLSELSKIKLEYEREDRKMNNEQLNNMMMNNNIGQPQVNQPSQGPTFGGRFFPSLEDEPTNMLGGNMNQMPTSPSMMNNSMDNNLIDLTDLTIEMPKINPSMDIQIPASPQITPAPEMNIPSQSFQMPVNDFVAPQLDSTPVAPQMDTVVSLENLQTSNPTIQSNLEPVSMGTLNTDFAPSPQMMPQTEFDMSQNMAPQMNPTPEITPQMGMPQTNFEMNQPLDTMIPNFDNNQPQMMPQPDFSIPSQMPELDQSMMNSDFGVSSQEMIATEPVMPTSSKDVTPVTNTIKSLVSNLESFGYKINIVEEDLINATKLIIEVEK